MPNTVAACKASLHVRGVRRGQPPAPAHRLPARACAPIFYIVRVRARRLRKFEENLPDAIDLFTRTMRAGHNIHCGLETIAAETADPVRMEFRKLMEELALGSQLEPALHLLGERVPLIDLKFFITSLILQRQTGANMVACSRTFPVGPRAPQYGRQAQSPYRPAAFLRRPAVRPAPWSSASQLLSQTRVHPAALDRPLGTKFLTYAIISEIVGILVDPQACQYQSMSTPC